MVKIVDYHVYLHGNQDDILFKSCSSKLHFQSIGWDLGQGSDCILEYSNHLDVQD